MGLIKPIKIAPPVESGMADTFAVDDGYNFVTMEKDGVQFKRSCYELGEAREDHVLKDVTFSSMNGLYLVGTYEPPENPPSVESGMADTFAVDGDFVTMEKDGVQFKKMSYELGEAVEGFVLKGVSFSSQNGLKLVGTYEPPEAPDKVTLCFNDNTTANIYLHDYYNMGSITPKVNGSNANRSKTYVTTDGKFCIHYSGAWIINNISNAQASFDGSMNYECYVLG